MATRHSSISNYHFNSYFFVLAIATVLLVSSCQKRTDDIPPTPELTSLNVVNATTDTLNFYINGRRINNLTSLYPFGASGYTNVPSGEQTFQFKKFGNPMLLFNLPLAIDTGTIYSAYISGPSAENSFVSKDTLKTDTGNRPLVRFVNASPDAGNLDVLVGDTVNFKVRAYKSVSVFLPVGPGRKHVRIYRSGVATAIVDTLRLMLPGRSYTLFSKGALNGTGGQKFGTGLVTNR